jgi:hypothetical protein
MKFSISAKLFSSIAAIVLLGCVLCSCGSPASQGTSPGLTSTPVNTTAAPTLQPSPVVKDYVELVYFHRTKQCYSCRYAGDTTKYTVETYFADELASGKLVFKKVDVQDKANASIVERYGAYGSSLFINDIVNGIDHIEPVTDIWYNVGKDEKFIKVVKDVIEKHLGNI